MSATASANLSVDDVDAGAVSGVGDFAVGRRPDGTPFAVERRCRHLRADLADGSFDEDGCLVCPWHHARYDVDTGVMVRGPQGIFAKIPFLGLAFRTLTKVLPLRKRDVVAADGRLTLRG